MSSLYKFHKNSDDCGRRKWNDVPYYKEGVKSFTASVKNGQIKKRID